MRRLGKQIFFIAVLMSLSFGANGQDSPSHATRSLIVNVFDRDGKVLRDLSKDNFRVQVSGKASEVVSASYTIAPRRIVVLLDMSGSMAGVPISNKKWQIARQALQDVLEQTPSTSEIAIVTFADKVHDVFDFSKGRPFLRHWAAQEPTMQSHVKGGTALLDAVITATQILQPSRAGDTIYAITDGGDNVSHASPGDVKKVLMRSGVRLYVFLFAEYVPRGAIWFSPAEFMEIARDSGGYIYGVPSRGEAPGTRYAPIQRFTYDLDQKGSEAIKAITQSLCAQIGGFYSLQIIDPELKKDGKLKIEVKANSGEPMKDVNSAYPSVLSRN